MTVIEPTREYLAANHRRTYWTCGVAGPFLAYMPGWSEHDFANDVDGRMFGKHIGSNHENPCGSPDCRRTWFAPGDNPNVPANTLLTEAELEF